MPRQPEILNTCRCVALQHRPVKLLAAKSAEVGAVLIPYRDAKEVLTEAGCQVRYFRFYLRYVRTQRTLEVQRKGLSVGVRWVA